MNIPIASRTNMQTKVIPNKSSTEASHFASSDQISKQNHVASVQY